MIHIRAAHRGDVEDASRVLCTAIRELCHADHRGDPALIAQWCANKTPAALLSWLETPNLRIFVTEHDGAVAGVGALETDGMVLLNYVAPHALGRGLSTAMLGHMEAVLSELGLTEAKLESTATARDYYRSVGWQDDGDPIWRCGMPGYPMRKALVTPAGMDAR